MPRLFRTILVKNATEKQIYDHLFPQSTGLRFLSFTGSELSVGTYRLSDDRSDEEEPFRRWHITERINLPEGSSSIRIFLRGEIRFISHIEGLEVHFLSRSVNISEEIRNFVDKLVAMIKEVADAEELVPSPEEISSEKIPDFDERESNFINDQLAKRIDSKQNEIPVSRLPSEPKIFSYDEAYKIITNKFEMKKYYKDYAVLTAKEILNQLPEAWVAYKLSEDASWRPGFISTYVTQVGKVTAGRYYSAFKNVGIYRIKMKDGIVIDIP
jgi:hypothetical protein